MATRLGTFGELIYAVAPNVSDAILNTAYKLFPESQAAKGKEERRKRGRRPRQLARAEGVAFAGPDAGVHWVAVEGDRPLWPSVMGGG